MKVYKTFLKIANSQKLQAFIYLGIFITLVVIMTNINFGKNDQYADTKCSIAIFDYDESEQSKKLVEYLTSIHDLYELEDDDDVILDNLYMQNVDYVLYINKGYSEGEALVNIKRPGTSEGAFIDKQIASYEKTMDILMDAGYTVEEAYEKTMDAMNKDGLVTMAEKKTVIKPKHYHVFIFVPYAGAMMLFNILAPVLVAINKKWVKNRTTVSPVSDKNRYAQMFFGTVTLAAIVWGVFSILGLIFAGSKMFEDLIPLCLLNIAVNLIVTTAFVTILGNYDLKEQTISMISNIYGLSTAFLGGIFVTLEIFGEGLLRLARFMPTYWYVLAQDEIFANGSVGKIFGYMGIQLIFALVFMVISLVISKRHKRA